MVTQQFLLIFNLMRKSAFVVLQFSRLPSIYYGLRKSIFTRWTGSTTAQTKDQQCRQTKDNATNTVASDPHECAVYCINLMPSKFWNISVGWNCKRIPPFINTIVCVCVYYMYVLYVLYVFCVLILFPSTETNRWKWANGFHFRLIFRHIHGGVVRYGGPHIHKVYHFMCAT